MVGFAGYAFAEPEDASSTLARMAEKFCTGSAMLARCSIVKSGFGICFVAREGAAFGLAETNTGAGEVVLAVEGNFAPSALGSGASIREDAIATLLLLFLGRTGGIDDRCGNPFDSDQLLKRLPHWLQYMASGKFSAWHLGQARGCGGSVTDRPQREQKRALGVRFLPQWAHWLKTTC